MYKDFGKEDVVIGISACLIGEKVRFDASNKPSNFCNKELGQHVTYKAYCPEVAVGMPIPRPTIRLIKDEQIIKVSRPDGSGDVTTAIKAYGKKIASISKNLSGYVFCAKSPTCGMERVKVYSPSGDRLQAQGIGVFSREIMKANPLLPCEENGRLNDPILKENFVARVFAYRHWQAVVESGVSKHKLTSFHAQYKYTLMSHDLIAYKQLGRLLASEDINVLKDKTTIVDGKGESEAINQRVEELSQQIDAYREGLMPLMVPLTLINHYLLEHPKSYLAQQAYLNPYPESLKLRYGY